MTMRVDTSGMVTTEEKLREDLTELGDALGVDVQVRFPADRETQTIAVLVTKESHCLEALFEAWANGDLGADIEVVIGNHDDLEPLAANTTFRSTTSATRRGRRTRTNCSICSHSTTLTTLRWPGICASSRPMSSSGTRAGSQRPPERALPRFARCAAIDAPNGSRVRVAGVTAPASDGSDRDRSSPSARSTSPTTPLRRSSSRSASRSMPRHSLRPSSSTSTTR